jgi:hypothetical protein
VNLLKLFWSFMQRLNLRPDRERLGLKSATLPLDRPLSPRELEIATWLLNHAAAEAKNYLPQLAVVRVVSGCGCGCPTVDLRVAQDVARALPLENPIADSCGEVNGQLVGVMLLQRGGYLSCLEICDLSDIKHPYGLPDVASLRILDWSNNT